MIVWCPRKCEYERTVVSHRRFLRPLCTLHDIVSRCRALLCPFHFVQSRATDLYGSIRIGSWINNSHGNNPGYYGSLVVLCNRAAAASTTTRLGASGHDCGNNHAWCGGLGGFDRSSHFVQVRIHCHCTFYVRSSGCRNHGINLVHFLLVHFCLAHVCNSRCHFTRLVRRKTEVHISD